MADELRPTLEVVVEKLECRVVKFISFLVYRLVHAPVMGYVTLDRAKAGFDSQGKSSCVVGCFVLCLCKNLGVG